MTTILIGLAPGDRGGAASHLGAMIARSTDSPLVVAAITPVPWPPSTKLGKPAFSELRHASWIVNGYLLAYVVAMPLAGRLADVWGARRLFLGALVILFCGFAYQIGRLVLGEQAAERGSAPDRERLDWGVGVTLVAALLAIVSTFYLPGPLMGLIRAAAAVVSEGT